MFPNSKIKNLLDLFNKESKEMSYVEIDKHGNVHQVVISHANDMHGFDIVYTINNENNVYWYVEEKDI